MIGRVLLMLLLIVPPIADLSNLMKQYERLSVKSQDLRGLLLKLNDLKADDGILAALFEAGDVQTAALLQLLNDKNKEVSLRAQIIIRYLGNDLAIKQLHQWLDRQQQIAVAGPVPVPLRERDYRVIRLNYLRKSPNEWRNAEPYVLALAIDGSAKAEKTLSTLAKLAGNNSESYTGRALMLVRNPSSRIQEVRFDGSQNLAHSILNNAFFILPEDRNHTSAKLIGFNQKHDKAIVEISINRGALSEEWYHVVVRISERSWRYLSITQVAVS